MLNVRKAQEKDLNRLLEIINEPGVIEHMPLERPVKRERVAGWLRSFQELGYPVIFVLELDEVIGACSLRENGKLTIWITAKHQGKGHGRQAMQHLIAYARNLGFKRIWLECQEENGRALEFYRALNFKKTGEVAGNIVMEMGL